MFGDNPIRPPVKGDGSTLDVQHIFTTFQGEGPYTGWPAVFIRLGGCNLACNFCDTEFESFSSQSLDDILSRVDMLSGKRGEPWTHRLIVITGGEPFRQPIEPLCDALITRGYTVQIETNGTLYRPIHQDVEIICSPKNSGTGYHAIRPDLLERITAFKFIISAHDMLYGDVGEVGQSAHTIPVYVQPMDEHDEQKNRKNMARVLEIAAEHGYRVSLQTHKVWGIE